jgi:hypothetical protein
MYRDKMKVIGAITLALSLTVGFLALSATNVAFAADKSALPSSQPKLVSDRVPGVCNYDGDQDQDDWCWSNTSASTTVTTTTPMTPTTGSSAAPSGAVPYGTIVGDNDKSVDNTGYGNGYSYGNNGGMGYNNRYDGRIYLFTPGRLGRLRRLFERRGIPFPPVFTNGEKVLLGRGHKLFWWTP